MARPIFVRIFQLSPSIGRALLITLGAISSFQLLHMLMSPWLYCARCPQPGPLFLNIHASRRRPDVSRASLPVNDIYPCSWQLGPLPVEISGVCALYLTGAPYVSSLLTSRRKRFSRMIGLYIYASSLLVVAVVRCRSLISDLDRGCSSSSSKYLDISSVARVLSSI